MAALLQHNTSGIMSRAGEGMDSPAGLAGHRYSTYNGVIELAIMEQVVEADGGDFADVELIPYTLEDEAGALMENLTDAIWVYYGWGGINAQLRGLDFDYFYFKDIDPVFDYYTPILIANNAFLETIPTRPKPSWPPWPRAMSTPSSIPRKPPRSSLKATPPAPWPAAKI